MPPAVDSIVVAGSAITEKFEQDDEVRTRRRPAIVCRAYRRTTRGKGIDRDVAGISA